MGVNLIKTQIAALMLYIMLAVTATNARKEVKGYTEEKQRIEWTSLFIHSLLMYDFIEKLRITILYLKE